jgi:hypothetical protein
MASAKSRYQQFGRPPPLVEDDPAVRLQDEILPRSIRKILIANDQTGLFFYQYQRSGLPE